MPKAKQLKVWPYFARKADYEDEDCDCEQTQYQAHQPAVWRQLMMRTM